MASLSNINGLFDVHSTGAILFSTSHGTSGQILRSNGNAAPTWVDSSTVIGGPYLPLTGGTLSGPLAGTSLTLSGTLTGTSATFVRDASGYALRLDSGDATTDNDLRFAKGGTDYAAIQVAGPAASDFQFYVNDGTNWINTLTFARADGQATFTKLVSGITPTAAANFATKAYVDAHPGSGGTVTGTGTNDYIPKWNAAGTGIENSLLIDTGALSYTTSQSVILTLQGTSAPGYAEINIKNDANNFINIGSIGSTYSGADWAGSTYVYNTGTGRKMYIKSQDELRLLTGGTSLSSNTALTIDTSQNATFTGLVSGITPTAAANFTTKAYVDSLSPPGGPYVTIGTTQTITANKTFSTLTSFTASESIYFKGARGQFTNEFMHLYNKVGIGNPAGWGQGETSTPNQGLSTYGAGYFAYGTGAGSTFLGDLTVSKGTPIIKALDGTNNHYLFIAADANNSFMRSDNNMLLQVDGGNVTALTFDNVGSATFSGYTYFPNYLFHAGDTNTRIFFETGKITLRGDTNIILSGGDVGIGVTAPEQKLHVEGRGIFDGGGSSDILQIRNDNGGGVFGMTSGLFALDLASTSSFRIRQGSSVPFYLKSDGNVGIGTSSPGHKLEVNGGMRAGIAGGSSGNIPGLKVYAASASTDTTAAIAIQQGTSEGDTIIFADYEPHVEWGISAQNSTDQIHFTAGSSTNNLGSKTFYNNAGAARTAYIKFNHDLTDGKTLIGGQIGMGRDYNGGIYAINTNSTPGIDPNWGLEVQRTANVNDYNTKLKYYPVSGQSRKAGIFDSRNNRFSLYSDTNNNPDILIPHAFLGIGNTSPTYRLQLGTSGDLASSIRLGTYAVAKNTRQYIGYTRADSGLFEESGDGDTPSTVLGGVAGIRIVNTTGTISSGAADNSVQLLTHIYNGGSRVALHASYNGNVGINNTSPDAYLRVDGTTSVTAARFYGTGGTRPPLELRQNNTAGWFAKFYSDNFGTYIGGISFYGSSTAFNTSSDYRLKENIIPISDSITRLKQLKPSRFNFKQYPEITIDGFLAHEVQKIVPEAVTGDKDELDSDGKPVYQAIDHSRLIPLLVAAIQELEARVKELENK